MLNNLILSIVSGALMALIFPQLNLSWLAWFGLLPLLFALSRTKDPRQAAWCGFFFGIPFYGITFSFISTLGEWVGQLIFLAWIILIVYYALYTALFGYLFKKLTGERFSFWLAPFLWTLIEWLRSLGPFGIVPHLGYSQWQWTGLIQIAALGGVMGLSFLIVWVNAWLAEAFFAKQPANRKLLFAALALVSLGLALGYGLSTFTADQIKLGRPLTLALVQGNYDQNEKLEFANLPKIKETYLQLSQQSLAGHPQIIVWPETAIPFYIQDDKLYLEALKSLAKNNRVNLALGLPRYENKQAYNSTLFISSNGEIIGWQDKHKLVPFGEYVPFRPIIIPFLKTIRSLKYTLFLQQDFSASAAVGPISTPVGKIGVGICSDAFFSEIFRDFDSQDVDYYLVITNLAWYKHSSAGSKQLMTNCLRAVEFRRYVVQSGNNGITAIIDPWGRVEPRLPSDNRAILAGKIYQVEGRSFYSRYGQWTDGLPLLFVAGYILFKKRKPMITAA